MPDWTHRCAHSPHCSFAQSPRGTVGVSGTHPPGSPWFGPCVLAIRTGRARRSQSRRPESNWLPRSYRDRALPGELRRRGKPGQESNLPTWLVCVNDTTGYSRSPRAASGLGGGALPARSYPAGTALPSELPGFHVPRVGVEPTHAPILNRLPLPVGPPGHAGVRRRPSFAAAASRHDRTHIGVRPCAGGGGFEPTTYPDQSRVCCRYTSPHQVGVRGYWGRSPPHCTGDQPRRGGACRVRTRPDRPGAAWAALFPSNER